MITLKITSYRAINKIFFLNFESVKVLNYVVETNFFLSSCPKPLATFSHLDPKRKLPKKFKKSEFLAHFMKILELSVKYSKESTKTLCLLKTRNKVVEVGYTIK